MWRRPDYRATPSNISGANFSSYLSTTMASNPPPLRSYAFWLFVDVLSSSTRHVAPAAVTDCLSYVNGDASLKNPEGNCCSGMNKVLKTDTKCLCKAFKNSVQFGLWIFLPLAISMHLLLVNVDYAEKRFVHKGQDNHHLLSVAQQLWESVCANDKKAAYRLIITYEADVNGIYGPASHHTSLNLSKATQFQEQEQSPDRYFDCLADCLDAATSSFSSSREGEDRFMDEFLDGCSLLHLACQTADIGMVELLLQHGANVNASDSKGQTPLHHCIVGGRISSAKLLLNRGADPQALDKEGKTPLQLVSETTDDVELLALLKARNR